MAKNANPLGTLKKTIEAIRRIVVRKIANFFPAGKVSNILLLFLLDADGIKIYLCFVC